MPLPYPTRYAPLAEPDREGRALIPHYAPAGQITMSTIRASMLIELFAWLIEQDIYRTNRIPCAIAANSWI
jgi:hypothetical protein